jgi:proton glutamate symport protein
MGTTETTAASVRRVRRWEWAAVASGVILLLAGVGCSIAGVHRVGATLRWLGLACLAAGAIKRPSLTVWTFLAMVAGVELGVDAPGIAAQVRLPGDLFLRLIRMIVAPLLFATMTTGIAGHSDLKAVGRVAMKALIYFEVVTTLGLLIGAVAMNLVGAGWGLAVETVSGATSGAAVPVTPTQSWQEFVLHIFPENIAQAVAQDQILQVAVFALLFGIALALVKEEKRAPLMRVLEGLAEVMFRLTKMIMYLAPLAAGAAIAYTVGKMGVGTLLPLFKLVATFYAALAVFLFAVCVPSLMIFRVPVRRFFQAAGEPAAIGFATTTSEAALPLAMERMEEFGVPRWIVSFVIPTGYSFNLTGASLYLSTAAVFVAQAAGIHLSVGRQAEMLLVLMVASKGVAGVPRASLVVLLATAASIGLPTAPILLILGVDTIIDMGRTMMNVLGNCMASAVVAKSEGVLTLS